MARSPAMRSLGSERVGIWLGDSFAEISAKTGEKPGPHFSTTRWLHSKKTVSETLRETLLKIRSIEKTASGEIRIATSRAEMSVTRRQGSEPFALVTAGFESWAKLGPRMAGATPTLRTERAWFPTSGDKTFGIAERTLADGQIQTPLKLDELEFLVAKLELMKAKEIAICFLHADRFPAHEKQAAAFFRERGFHVIASHELPGASGLNEVERIRRTIECAFAEAVVRDDFESLQKVLTEEKLEDDWKIRFWTTNGIADATSASFVRGGVETALLHAIPADVELAYFFGLEEFLGFQRLNDGSLASYLLPVQPTCQIGASSWPFPSWSSVDRGYEPGPMLFGKSHQLTLLDILFVRDALKGDIEGFSDRVQAKTSARILEAIATLGKNLAEPGRRGADAKDIAEDLESGFVERLSMDLSFKLSKAAKVFVAGPLAPSVLPLLERRRSDVQFIVEPELTISTAALGRTI